MWRDALEEFQEGLQPLGFGPAVGGDLDSGVAAGDVPQRAMTLISIDRCFLLRVWRWGGGQVVEVGQDGCNRAVFRQKIRLAPDCSQSTPALAELAARVAVVSPETRS